MENAQRTRTKGLAQPTAEDAHIRDAFKKASADAKRRATTNRQCAIHWREEENVIRPQLVEN